METKTASVWRSSLMAGIFTGIALILFEMIRHSTDQLYNQKIGFISILIIAAGVILAQLNFRKNQNNVLFYGQGAGIAAITGAIAGIFLLIYTFLLYKFIDPELYQEFLIMVEEETVNRFAESGMSEEQIQMTLDMQQKLQTPFILAAGALFNTFITGLLAGLITAAFVKKKPEEPFSEFE